MDNNQKKEELLQFDFDDNNKKKPNSKIPKRFQRKMLNKTNKDKPKPEPEQSLTINQNDQKQVKESQNDQKDDKTEQNQIKVLITSRKFQQRVQGYSELIQWEGVYTKTDFIKDLHTLVKEKHNLVIDKLLTAIESVLEDQLLQKNLEFETFVNNFAENLLSNCKGNVKIHAMKVFNSFWDNWDNKDQFINSLDQLLNSKKMKIQEKSASLILELVKDGNIEELKNLNQFFKAFQKLLLSRTAIVRNAVIKIYKEAYLWLGNKLTPQIESLKKQFQKDINNYISTISESEMKIGQKKIKKTKKSSETISQIQNQDIKPKKSLTQKALKNQIEKNISSDEEDDIKPQLSETFETIEEIKMNMFSDKNNEIKEAQKWQNIIDGNMKNIIDLTDSFENCKKIQIKQMYLIINEISEKLMKDALSKFSRNKIALFYIKQMSKTYSEKVFESIEIYSKSKNELIDIKTIMEDLLKQIIKQKIYLNIDLTNSLARLIENEILKMKSIQTFNHKQFVDFVRLNVMSSDILIKKRIFNLMRNISQLFGKNVLNDYPSKVMQEFEIENKEIDKKFSQSMMRLKEKNTSKRKLALLELEDEKDPTIMQMFWSSREFLNFIKRSLITETSVKIYKKIMTIVLNYLEFHQNSPADFSLKSYLYIFHTIITQYYDLVGSENRQKKSERFDILQDIFIKTIHELKPTIIFNQMIGDINSQSWKEQILGFYLQYGTKIDVEMNFIDYIINILNTKNYDLEIKNLIDKVLLQLKNTGKDEIIDKGTDNKTIREIWQKNEEDILFADDFIEFERIFKDKGFFESVKNFILKALKMDEKAFFALRIDSLIVDSLNNNETKAKIAYLYLKSTENLPQIAEHIYSQISKLDLSTVDTVTLLIIIRILINLIRNNYYAQSDSLYQDVMMFFSNLLHNIGFTLDQLTETLKLEQFEVNILQQALQYITRKQEEEVVNNEDPFNNTISMLNKTVNDSHVYEQYPMDDQSRYFGGTQNLQMQINKSVKDISAKKRKNSRISKKPENLKEHTLSINSQSRISRTSLSKRNKLYGLKKQDQDLGNQAYLQDQFNNMLTFDLDKFEEASDYFKMLCSSPNLGIQQFLFGNSDQIMKVFTEVIKTVFAEGINYDLQKESYRLIFDPVKVLSSKKGVLDHTDQNTLNEFIDQLLNGLVNSNEEKTYLQNNQNEQDKIEFADYIVIYFNRIMLRTIENSEPNMLFTSFFLILFNLKNQIQDPVQLPVFQLTLRCVLRMSKNLKNNINSINPRVILNLIHNYIEVIGMKNQNNNGSKIIKRLLKELVSYTEPEFIWECYKDVFENINEPYIQKWIKVLQNDIFNNKNQEESSEAERKLLQIIEMINQQNQISQLSFYANEIIQILNRYPSINFQNFSGYFRDKTYFDYFLDEIRDRNPNVKMKQIKTHKKQKPSFDVMDKSYLSNQSKKRYLQLNFIPFNQFKFQTPLIYNEIQKDRLFYFTNYFD